MVPGSATRDDDKALLLPPINESILAFHKLVDLYTTKPLKHFIYCVSEGTGEGEQKQ